MKLNNNIENEKNKQEQDSIENKLLTGKPEAKSLTLRPRIVNLSTLYNVSDVTLINFLNNNGFVGINKHSLLNTNALKLIDKYFEHHKKQKDKIRGVTNINFVNHRTDEEINTHRTDEEIEYKPITVQLLKNNIFETLKTEIYFKDYPNFKTYFSNEQAINICSKMTSSFTRNLCNQLNINNVKNEFILYQLHFIANKALNIYGGNILTFLLLLRRLEFKNKTAKEVRTYSKVNPDFPILNFKIPNNNSIKISFFLKRINNSDIHKADMRVFESKGFKEIGYLDVDGFLHAKLEKFKPQLSFFFEATQSNRLEFYAGVETGLCDVCNRELTHPNSLRIGIGPICAQLANIDKSLYTFI